MLSRTQIALLAHQARSCLQMGPLAATGGFRTCRGSRCVLLGLTSMGVGNSSGTSSLLSSSCGVLNSHFVSARFVQFAQRESVVDGVGKATERVKSSSASTAAVEHDDTGETAGTTTSTPKQAASMQQKPEVSKCTAATEGEMRTNKTETGLPSEEVTPAVEGQVLPKKVNRFGKLWNFLKAQGKPFLILYTSVYLGGLVILYLCFASGLVEKEIVYNFVLNVLSGVLDGEEFQRKLKSWDAYIDFGLALILNELLEVVRLPLSLTFLKFRPYLARVGARIKGSVLRTGVPRP